MKHLNRTNLSLSFLLILLGTFIGCATESSDDVNPDRISQVYSATYDQAKNQTTAVARFGFGQGFSTAIRLDSPSRVSHDSIPLQASEGVIKEVFGISYSGTKSNFVPTHVFEYVDKNGKEYTNQITIPTVAFRGDVPKTTHTTGSLTIEFSEPLLAGESATLTVGENSLATATNFTTGASEVTIPQAQMAGLPSGATTLKLERRLTRSLQEGTSVGGTISGSYIISAPIDVIGKSSDASPMDPRRK